MTRKLWRVIRWGIAVILSVGVGVVGAVLALYAGIYLRSLLLALVAAWLGFTASAYVAFLVAGWLLRINTAAIALPTHQTRGSRKPNVLP